MKSEIKAGTFIMTFSCSESDESVWLSQLNRVYVISVMEEITDGKSRKYALVPAGSGGTMDGFRERLPVEQCFNNLVEIQSACDKMGWESGL